VYDLAPSAANYEIAKTEVSCIPYGISPKTLGGDFIQEGANNIDLNTETIDGKNNKGQSQIKWSEVVFVQRYYHFGYSNT
jgi:hypothetical protein